MNFHFRTNVNTKIGIGHLMRTSKIAKKLKKLGNNCFFYLDNDTKFIKILKTFKVQYLYNQGRHFQNQLIDANLFLDRIKDIKVFKSYELLLTKF